MARPVLKHVLLILAFTSFTMVTILRQNIEVTEARNRYDAQDASSGSHQNDPPAFSWLPKKVLPNVKKKQPISRVSKTHFGEKGKCGYCEYCVKQFKAENVISSCEEGSDCHKLQGLVWPEGKPRAAIYYLVGRVGRSNDELKKSLESLHKYFNERYKYPIIVFHEGMEEYAMNTIRSYTDSTLYFAKLDFKVPSFINETRANEPSKCSGHTVGYKHMCRFHSKVVYEQPITQGMDYLWRLDDDSFLLSNVTYDVIDFMHTNDLYHGYMHIKTGACMDGLWESADDFLSSHNISTCFYKDFRGRRTYFYNNFEISKVAFWKSKIYQTFIGYIDHLGGIYYERWGDAPLKGMAVAMFMEKKKTHKFTDFGYKHGKFVNKVK